MSTEKQKPNPTAGLISKSFAVIFLLFLFVILIFMSGFTIVDGKVMANTAVPTVTSSIFTVKAKVISLPQITGSEFSGYYTWVTVRIIGADRKFSQGEEYNIRFPTKLAVVEKDDKIVLSCWDSWEKELYCYDEFQKIE